MRYFAAILISIFVDLHAIAQISGCTDPLANNYNPNATINNGSCTYNSVTVSPITTYTLVSQLNETSGLIFWNDTIYTHNDNTDKRIYALDSSNGSIVKTYSLGGITNIDWEEITEDSTSVYLGDFGNNANGNRTNLRIYKISKVSLWNNNPQIDTIKFAYSNQTSFAATGSNNTDFDCEAFIATKDSLYLFTKQWVSKKTSLYKLPKTAGIYTAQFILTHDVQGLITGATFVKDKNMVALCGYTNLLQPFFYMLYDFKNNAFFSGNKRKINLSTMFHQTEGITTKNGSRFYVSNEFFNQSSIINVTQKLSVYDLGIYLYPALSLGTLENVYNKNGLFKIFTSLVNDEIVIINTNKVNFNYQIHDIYSKLLLSGINNSSELRLPLSGISSGFYTITIHSANTTSTFKFIKE